MLPHPAAMRDGNFISHIKSPSPSLYFIFYKQIKQRQIASKKGLADELKGAWGRQALRAALRLRHC
jgi:hypothetical protein